MKDNRKPATIIAELKRSLKERTATANDALGERNHYRARATKAEQECAEWKRRFDLLLARTPELPAAPLEPQGEKAKEREGE